MIEIWKEYCRTKLYVYEFSNYGRMRKNGKLVKFKENQAYYRISFGYVHRIIAELFIHNPENKPCVDHIDTNTHNNRVDNLRWCTYEENNNNPITKHHNEIAHIGKLGPFFKNKNHKQETKDYLSELAKDRKWINKDGSCKFVKPEELDYYFNIGYCLGRK